MKKLLCLLLCLLVCCAACTALAADLPGPDTSKKVKDIEVYQLPDKTVYVVGDTFSAAGGILKITYDDGTEGYIAMDDETVTVKAPTMNTVNTKNVQVRYEGSKLTFKVEVAAGMCQVTFDTGDGQPLTAEVSKGAQVEAPETPVREGYTLVGWYANEDYTHPYDFGAEVESDMTIYALWLKDGAEKVNVTFDYDYYGVMLNKYTYPVESGATVKQPVQAPVRTGYTFDKWLAEDGSDFDFTKPVTADTTIRAAWKKNSQDAQTWVFEAEDTDLTGKIGPSYSGSAQEESMIIFNDGVGASNNRLVGYLYEPGLSLEFYVASDSDVSDAVLTVSIAGEYTTMSYDGNDYQVLVNGEAKSYPRVTIEADSQTAITPCKDLIQITGVSLKQGENLIQLKTNNTNSVAGTTFKANAPMVDCVKLTTTAVVIWDENHGEPALDNYQK